MPTTLESMIIPVTLDQSEVLAGLEQSKADLAKFGTMLNEGLAGATAESKAVEDALGRVLDATSALGDAWKKAGEDATGLSAVVGTTQEIDAALAKTADAAAEAGSALKEINTVQTGESPAVAQAESLETALKRVAEVSADTNDAWKRMVEEQVSQGASLVDAIANATEAVKEMGSALQDVKLFPSSEEAMSFLGVKSQAELDEAAGKARMAYNQISEDASRSAREIDDAWMKMTEAMVAAGERLTDEEIKHYQEIKSANKEVTDQLKSNWEKASEEAVESLSRQTDAMAESMQNLGRMLGGVVGGLAIGSLFHKASEAAMEFDEVVDTVTARTGVMGERLEEMGNTWVSVMSRLPASSDQVKDALIALTRSLGLTGSQLEIMTEKVVRFSNLTGTSVAGNVDAMTKAFRAWGVESERQGELMEFFFRASQQTNMGITGLISAVGRSAPFLREMGLSLEDATGLFIQMDKAGTSAMQVITGFRGAMTKMAKSGEDPAKAFETLVSQIKNATDGTTALNLAIEKGFAGRVASSLVNAIRSGTLDLQSFRRTIADSTDSIDRAAERTLSYADVLKRFKNQVELAFEPFGTVVNENLSSFLKSIRPAMSAARDLGESFKALPGPIRDTTAALIGLALAIPGILAGLGAVTLAAKGFLSLIATGSMAIGGWMVSMVGLTASASTLTNVLTAASAAARIAVWLGLAMALYETYSAIYKLVNAMQDLDDATKKEENARNRLINHLKSLGYNVDGLTEKYNQGKLSWIQYMQELQKLAKEAGDTIGKTFSGIANNVNINSAVQTLGIKTRAELEENLRKAQEAYDLLKKASTFVGPQPEGVKKIGGFELVEGASKVQELRDQLDQIRQTAAELAVMDFGKVTTKALSGAGLDISGARQIIQDFRLLREETVLASRYTDLYGAALEGLVEKILKLSPEVRNLYQRELDQVIKTYRQVESAAAMGKLKNDLPGTTEVLKQMGVGFDDLGAAQRRFSQGWSLLNELFEAGLLPAEKMNAAIEKGQELFAKYDLSNLVDALIAGATEMDLFRAATQGIAPSITPEMRKVADEIRGVTQTINAIGETTIGLTPQFKGMSDVVSEMFRQMAESAERAAGKISDEFHKLYATVTDGSDYAAARLVEAFSRLATHKDYWKVADIAAEDFERVAASGVATAEEITEAFLKMQVAELEALSRTADLTDEEITYIRNAIENLKNDLKGLTSDTGNISLAPAALKYKTSEELKNAYQAAQDLYDDLYDLETTSNTDRMRLKTQLYEAELDMLRDMLESGEALDKDATRKRIRNLEEIVLKNRSALDYITTGHRRAVTIMGQFWDGFIRGLTRSLENLATNALVNWLMPDNSRQAQRDQQAITALGIAAGVSGKQLEDLVQTIENLAAATGQDFRSIAEQAAAVFKRFGVSVQDQIPTLTALYSIAKTNKLAITDLMAGIEKAGPVLSALGLNVTQSAMLFGSLSASGEDAGKVFDELTKAFEKYRQMGYSHPEQALLEVIRRIKEAGTAAEANEQAIATFGDAGIWMAGIIRSGKLDIQDFTGSLQDAGEELKKTAEEMKKLAEEQNKGISLWDQFKRAMLEALAQAGVQAVGKLILKLFDAKDAADLVWKAIKQIGEWLGIMGKTADTVKKSVDAVTDSIKKIPDVSTGKVPGTETGGVPGTISAGGGGLLEAIGFTNTFMTAFNTVFSSVMQAKQLAVLESISKNTAIMSGQLQLSYAQGNAQIQQFSDFGQTMPSWIISLLNPIGLMVNSLFGDLSKFMASPPTFEQWGGTDINDIGQWTEYMKAVAAWYEANPPDLTGKFTADSVLGKFAAKLDDVAKLLWGITDILSNARDLLEKGIYAELLKLTGSTPAATATGKPLTVSGGGASEATLADFKKLVNDYQVDMQNIHLPNIENVLGAGKAAGIFQHTANAASYLQKIHENDFPKLFGSASPKTGEVTTIGAEWDRTMFSVLTRELSDSTHSALSGLKSIAPLTASTSTGEMSDIAKAVRASVGSMETMASKTANSRIAIEEPLGNAWVPYFDRLLDALGKISDNVAAILASLTAGKAGAPAATGAFPYPLPAPVVDNLKPLQDIARNISAIAPLAALSVSSPRLATAISNVSSVSGDTYNINIDGRALGSTNQGKEVARVLMRFSQSHGIRYRPEVPVASR